MSIRIHNAFGIAISVGILSTPAMASPFVFSTGSVTDQIATASRPGPASGSNQETESADDFVLKTDTRINSATFTGLLPARASVDQVTVEIYRVFPDNFDVGRTDGPPTFSTSQVPTRYNSPSDVELVGRESSAGQLTFTTNVLDASFTAAASVDTKVALGAGSQGPVTGQEAQFDVAFTQPLDLLAGHYFFVPQVLLTDADQHFLWLSASRPIDATGTPFAPDLQSWMRNAELDPDWLRIGSDIIGGKTFNAAFSLAGVTIPEPASLSLLTMALAGFGMVRLRRGRSDRT